MTECLDECHAMWSWKSSDFVKQFENASQDSFDSTSLTKMGISLSRYDQLVDQQQRQLAVRFYPRWCYVRSGVGVLAWWIGLAMNRFYTRQTKIFGPKNFRIWFFLPQKINLEDTLIFGGEYSMFPNPYIIGQMHMKLKHKEQSIRNYYFQVSFVYVR